MLQDDGFDSTGTRFESLDTENTDQPYRIEELEQQDEDEIEMSTILIKPKPQ